ncbi:hypothetical protein DFR42_103118 [Undibacterium pigrum]|uniref:Uncharacterized protein n=1 Tax=Undibacterium pigrum TaxID=401470 RepID=A0A318J850_9BURK|nr:hypothetical protein DFR42_103118 [Undibacterium pigrum]
MLKIDGVIETQLFSFSFLWIEKEAKYFSVIRTHFINRNEMYLLHNVVWHLHQI